MKLALQHFIEQHADWEDLLSKEPYCFQISRDHVCGRDLVLFKYSQIDTKWHEAGKIAWEARGIVLDEKTLEVVNYGFDKFFNSAEVYADEIDASSMISSVKVDGSIIKIRRFPDNQLLISTNGTIDAFKAPVAEQMGCSFKSFGDIVADVLTKKFGSVDAFKQLLDNDKTYIFEMVSPWTRVCTPYPENDMYLIGCRFIDPSREFREIKFTDCSLAAHFKTPEILDFSSIDKCLEYASTLDWTKEGYVIMDAQFHRVKCKNPSWLAVHHLAENHTMSYVRAVEIVRANEVDEVVGYFPEFQEALDEVKARYAKLIADLDAAYNRYLMYADCCVSRKDHALAIQKEFGKYAGCGFCLLDSKVSCSSEWVEKLPARNLVKTLGYKED